MATDRIAAAQRGIILSEALRNPSATQRRSTATGTQRRARQATGAFSGPDFDSQEVAETLVRHRLTYGNIPPSESADLGRVGGATLLWHAIMSHEVCELWGTRDAIERCKPQFKENSDVADDLTGIQSAGHYIWRPDREDAVLVADISSALSRSRHQTHFLLDLGSLASHLVEEARRPLIKIELGTTVFEERVRGFA